MSATPFPVAVLLAELKQRGVTLLVAGDRLRYHPRGAMTPSLASRLSTHRASVVTALTRGTGTEAPDGAPETGGSGAELARNTSRSDRCRVTRGSRGAASLHSLDGCDYPAGGVHLERATHTVAKIPVVSRVHFSDAHEGGSRWEALRCRQPDGDGLIGWAVVTDVCYLPIVRERGVIKTLTVAAALSSRDLREVRR